uniref:Uncharacterized protein n=1 Tax=Fundidesulfovibrio putealis TaxID=270496 RepID=A0A7C4ELP6_9BACT
MKIQADQIAAVQGTTRVSPTTTVPASNFGEILARELDSGQQAATAGVPPVLAGAAGLTQAMAAQAMAGVSDVATDRQAVMENVDSLLNQWEKYAGQLADGSSGQLRQAYGTLETIQTGVKKLKDEHPGLDGHSPQLSSMVNELEVMAATEKIKFNRGDYL